MKARDVMSTAVVTISTKATIFEAAKLMLNRGISGVPVVDADDRGEGEHPAVGPLGEEVLLLEPLPHLGEELHRPVRTGLCRAEPALHEAHHLEQEEVDDRAGRQQHGREGPEAAQRRLLPVGQLDRDHHRRALTGRCPRG